MIESIKAPLDSLHELLGKKLGAYFRKDGNGYLVADGKNERGLRAQIMLRPETNGFMAFFAEQDEPRYDSVAIKDVWNFAFSKSGVRRLNDYIASLRVHLEDEDEAKK